MDNQIEELKEDLEAEKSARTKAEKQRRELGEVSLQISAPILAIQPICTNTVLVVGRAACESIGSCSL